MRLMITGGCGFIGSALVRYCIQHTDHEILNIDKLTYAACPDSLRDVDGNSRYRFEQADIADAGQMQSLLAAFKPDAIMHLAAESHVDRSIDGPSAFIETNIVGTFVLLDAARQYHAGLDKDRQASFRFHHISTDEVYGSLGSEGFFTEKSPYAPNSPYSASKASSDMLVRAWHETYGLPVVISNCSNNYGPFQFPEKLIPVIILAALEQRPIPVYGDGKNIRDWLYVDDHVRALLTVLQKGVPGETYVIGGNSERSNIDLVKTVCRIIDELRPAGAPHEKLISYVKDRPGHDKRYAIDATKIARELGWKPQVDVEEGLRQTVTWFLENSWWWEKIRARGFKTERLGVKAARVKD